eukprot:TRINITY_DN71183_c0_g1_i1.p1 TRINITY_DN71183_c0_g1~~TRINITY_DN71183_c0_g1_i1.p1  ORF type:complete len:272 (+),score=19.60 TRINITY_DN71183_c0_g1_i1:82-897(+)
MYRHHFDGGACGGPGCWNGPLDPCGGCAGGGRTYSPRGDFSQSCNVYVECIPEVYPKFYRGPGETFVLEVDSVLVKLSTTSDPEPRLDPGMVPFKPYEQFRIELPEVSRVIFDPNRDIPRDGRIWTQVRKRGAVMEVPPSTTLDGRVKTNSPYGSLIIDNVSGYSFPVGEDVLNWRLQVTGQMSEAKGAGHMGAKKLEVDFVFLFDCYMGGPAVAHPKDGDAFSGDSYGYQHGHGNMWYGNGNGGYCGSWPCGDGRHGGIMTQTKQSPLVK